MGRLAILGGAYSDASLIASAQRAINLYPEQNSQTQQAPVPVTHYPRPGLTPKSMPPAVARGRCLYVATNGDLYAVVGQTLYYIDPNFNYNAIGVLPTNVTTPVYIADNGVTALVVDGSALGLQIDLATRVATAIVDPNFLGGARVTFLNYFLLLNEPGTPNFYSTQATSVVFNALAFGSLTEWPGNVQGLIASEAALWIFSPQKGEVWADAGTSPFAFQPLSGVIIEHGLAGSYALGRYDKNVYWLSQSPEGGRVAMQGFFNTATRISTHAIEEEWLSYPIVSDCIVQTYQIRGHAFVLYHFPTADRTWVFDAITHEWHEEAFFDINGVQHRTRDTFMAYAYGLNLSLDWATGQLYQRDETNFSDNGVPIQFLRSMPHMVSDQNLRVTLWKVIADMECGNGPGVQLPYQIDRPWSLGFSSGFGPAVIVEPPVVTLQVSRDRGFSFTTHSLQPMAAVTSGGNTSSYNVRPTFNRCGTATDFVLQLEWAGPMKSALNGVFIETEEHQADA